MSTVEYAEEWQLFFEVRDIGVAHTTHCTRIQVWVVTCPLLQMGLLLLTSPHLSLETLSQEKRAIVERM